MVASARRDLVANYLGRGVSVLVGILVLPVYRDALGPERFGIVAFFTMVQSLLATLDAGLGAAFLQRISRTVRDPSKSGELRDIGATFAALGSALGAITFLIVAATSPVIPDLLRIDPVFASETRAATIGLAALLGAWWPNTFFQGTLVHLGRQPESNGLSAVFALLRALTTYVVLRHFEPSLIGYAAPQAVLSAAQCLVLGHRVRAALPDRRFGTVTTSIVLEELPTAFALGISALLGILITNTDRAALASFRPVEDLGTYGFAMLAMTAVGQLVGPVHATYYPRLCESRDARALEALYLQAQRVALAVALPATLTMAVHASTILRLWTGDVGVEMQASRALTILAIAALVNAPLQIVLALALSRGLSANVARMQAAAGVVYFVVCPWLVWRLGIDGAAIAVLAFNTSLAAWFVTRTHRVLAGHATTRRWLTVLAKDAGPMLAISAGVLFALRLSEALWHRVVLLTLGTTLLGLLGVRALRAASSARPSGGDG